MTYHYLLSMLYHAFMHLGVVCGCGYQIQHNGHRFEELVLSIWQKGAKDFHHFPYLGYIFHWQCRLYIVYVHNSASGDFCWDRQITEDRKTRLVTLPLMHAHYATEKAIDTIKLRTYCLLMKWINCTYIYIYNIRISLHFFYYGNHGKWLVCTMK